MLSNLALIFGVEVFYCILILLLDVIQQRLILILASPELITGLSLQCGSQLVMALLELTEV
jgi:hypothetical protein